MTNETRPATPATDEEIADTKARARRVTGIGSVRALKLIARIAADAEIIKALRSAAEIADLIIEDGDATRTIRDLRAQVETLREALRRIATMTTSPGAGIAREALKAATEPKG